MLLDSDPWIHIFVRFRIWIHGAKMFRIQPLLDTIYCRTLIQRRRWKRCRLRWVFRIKCPRFQSFLQTSSVAELSRRKNRRFVGDSFLLKLDKYFNIFFNFLFSFKPLRILCYIQEIGQPRFLGIIVGYYPNLISCSIYISNTSMFSYSIFCMFLGIM